MLDASFSHITAGDAMPITVVRDGKKLTFTMQAAFHPASQRPPLLAAPPTINQMIPLRLEFMRAAPARRNKQRCSRRLSLFHSPGETDRL